MSDFKVIPVGSHLKLTSGFPFASASFSNEGFPLIRIRDVLSSTTETSFKGAYPPGYVIKAGNILIGMDGDFHVVKWRGPEALLNQRVLKVDVQDQSIVVLDYVFHWLGPFIKKINDVTAATTVKHLSTKDIVKANARFPSVTAQRRIAAILTSIDTAIEKTEALIAKYQQIKAGLMHDLFTRGVLSNGQLRPPREQAPELYQETTVGWLPKNWEVRPLARIADVIDPNPSHRNPIYHPEGFPFISTVEFDQNDEIELNTSRRVILAIVEEQERRCKFSKNSIGFSRKGTIGEIRFLPSHIRFALLDSLCVINPKQVNSGFLFYSLRSECLTRQAKNMTMGQALPQVSIGRVRDLLVPIPPKEEQIVVAEKVEALMTMLRGQAAYLKTLKNEKSGLLQDLLTGKVLVKVDAGAPELIDG